MNFIKHKRVSRRDFLKGSAVAATAPLVIGIDAAGNVAVASESSYVSDFVHVTADDRVVVIVKHVEAGQGPATGLATLVAEEMNADWDRIEAVFAPADNMRYANLAFGIQGTGGSTAIANSYMQYRQAGAVALAQLKAAAAKEWNTKPAKIAAKDGMLTFGGKKARFGEMAVAAGKMEPSLEKPTLKSYDDFSLIGRDGADRLARKDLGGKTTGTATFAMDYSPDNLLYAVVARSPRFGGTLSSFDDSEARKVNGFVGAKAIPSGVAVYGESPWAAIKARKAIKAKWDDSAAETRSTPQMFADYWKAVDGPGLPAMMRGDADGQLASSAKTVSADFEFPFLSHAPMEPLNCVMQFKDGKVTLWDGCQMPGLVQGVLSHIFEVPPENVEIVSLFAGGTFGRRATPGADYQSEAAHALKASPAPDRPLKTLWTREDDIQGGYYRPMFAHRVQAGVDADGMIHSWRHDVAGKSILIGTPFEGFAVKEGVDQSMVGGIANLAYESPNLLVTVRHMQESPVPVLWWRSVEHTHTGFSSEVMVDMLAEAAGADQVEFRLRHLGDHPRHTGVLRAVAEAANWSGNKIDGGFRGVALHESFGSFVAQVVDISLNDKGAVSIDKVYCAIDCGVAVNPDIVRAQMESCIGYGLGAVMRNEVTLNEGGEVEQTNFPNYRPLRINDMPQVETIVVKSREAPSGVGEPGVPPVGPALSGAIYAATGKRVTKLPFDQNGISFA